MIQNVFENQIYYGLVKNKSDKKKKINKYFEYNFKEIDESNKMEIDDIEGEDLTDDDTDVKNSIFLERLVLSVTPIKTKDTWTHSLKEKSNLDKESELSSYKFIVYEYDEDLSKINENRLLVGIVYKTKTHVFLHNWLNIHNFTKLIPTICNLKCSNNNFNALKLTDLQKNGNSAFEKVAFDCFQNFDFKSARSLLSEVLVELFAGDTLSVEYFILCMTSQIFHKMGSHITGKLSLNISDVSPKLSEKEYEFSKDLGITDFVSSIHLLLSNILFNFLGFKNTIDNLNKIKIFSEFDVNSEELKKGILQTVDHTFLLLDERELTEGKLIDAGVKNLECLKTLIDLQVMMYEYPYSNVSFLNEYNR